MAFILKTVGNSRDTTIRRSYTLTIGYEGLFSISWEARIYHLEG